MTETWKQWEGQVVNGEFHLRRYLGGSDHSAVFLTERGAREPQKVAIKLIPADPRKAELQLFRWRLAAKLSHPNLIRIFGMGRCSLDGAEVLYVVMEYAEEDLSQVLPHRPLTPAEAREMLQPALDALAYLHSKGFAHSRMKSANIMAIGDQLKLSSDGLRRIGESSGRSGKPGGYDPPETASGGVSPAGDVWSLGMTLAEALTQRLPVWERTEQGDPALPEAVPEPFGDIARHCLRRDPQHRWTVGDIAARLQPTSSVPQRHATARPQMTFANWRYIVPTVAISFVLMAILVGPRLLNRRPEAQRTASIVSERPRAQPKPDQRPVTPETVQSTRETGERKQSSSGPPPMPASLRSGAAKAPTDGLVQGEVAHQILPDVPQKARDTIRGTVRVTVRVAVDPSGSVAGAMLDSPGPSKYFANLALQAARRWKFWPAKVDGRYVPSEWILRFEFERSTTRVRPVQAAP